MLRITIRPFRHDKSSQYLILHRPVTRYTLAEMKWLSAWGSIQYNTYILLPDAERIDLKIPILKV